MLEQLKYKNHLNEVFEFGKDGIFVNLNDLHDYEWNVQKKGNRISSLNYAIRKKKIPVVIMCDTEEKGVAAKNRLLEVAEKDVLALQPGRIIIGDYYMKCYITKSQKKDYQKTKRYLSVTLTATTDMPYWIKETATYFNTTGITDSEFLDYAIDHPYDYALNTFGTTLVNTGFVDSNFKIIIHGACVNPAIHIGDHTYQVNCEVGANEYLTIDSSSKKIYLTSNSGEISNKFNNRNRDSYIFQKIPSGSSVVSWDGTFNFDIILLEERSEPRWT